MALGVAGLLIFIAFWIVLLNNLPESPPPGISKTEPTQEIAKVEPAHPEWIRSVESNSLSTEITIDVDSYVSDKLLPPTIGDYILKSLAMIKDRKIPLPETNDLIIFYATVSGSDTLGNAAHVPVIRAAYAVDDIHKANLQNIDMYSVFALSSNVTPIGVAGKAAIREFCAGHRRRSDVGNLCSGGAR